MTLIVLAIRFFIPVLIDEIGSLASNLEAININEQTEKLTLWLDQRWPQLRALIGFDTELVQRIVLDLREGVTGFLGQSLKIIGETLNTMSLAIVVPFIAFFLLRDSDSWMKNLVRNVPNRYFEMAMSLIDKVNKTLGKYIRSILLESLIISVISWLAFLTMGVRFALVLGVINGLLNMIPFFGPIIAVIPVLLVVLITYTPILFGIVYAIIILIVVQVIDNVLLKPALISRSVNVHPVVVLLAVLIGGRIAGPLGMFIAVPVYAVLHTLVVDLYTHLKEYRII